MSGERATNRSRARKYEHGRKCHAWTPEEDEVLMRHCDLHGRGQWSLAAKLLPGRTNKQCRERYQNQLMNGIKAGEWTHEEDEKILRLQIGLGNNWSVIAAQLPGRTANAVKNRFNSAAFKNGFVHSSQSSSPASHKDGSDPKKRKLGSDEFLLQWGPDIFLDHPNAKISKKDPPALDSPSIEYWKSHSWSLCGPSSPRSHILHHKALLTLFSHVAHDESSLTKPVVTVSHLAGEASEGAMRSADLSRAGQDRPFHRSRGGGDIELRSLSRCAGAAPPLRGQDLEVASILLTLAASQG